MNQQIDKNIGIKKVQAQRTIALVTLWVYPSLTIWVLILVEPSSFMICLSPFLLQVGRLLLILVQGWLTRKLLCLHYHMTLIFLSIRYVILS